MLEKIRAQGAEVEVFGNNWNEADARARWLVEEGGREGGKGGQGGQAAYIPPYDHPLLWQGHSSLVDELVESGIEKPAAIVASVGGGGLLCGIFEGLSRYENEGEEGREEWGDVGVVGAETEGAASFAAGMAAGKVVRLEGISSLATSLGALEVTPQALKYALKGGREGGVGGGRRVTLSEVVSDKEAVHACRRFLQDHRLLVEPACGAALALVYSKRGRDRLKAVSDAKGGRPVVVVVCGGSGITPEILLEMERSLGLVA